MTLATRSGMRIVALGILAAALVAGSVKGAERKSMPATSSDTVASCPGNRELGNTGVYYGDLSVRNLSCRQGRRLLRTATLRSGGVRIRGYKCRLIGTYGDGGIYRCTRKHYALRFSAGG
jgi:hypothetical protein